jgi:hypothetical protein
MTADQLLAEIEREKEARARELPTIEDCLRMNVKLHQRMRELGWRDAIYCPKDGTEFDAIEFGCGAAGTCHYDGEWPKGSWWMHSEGDLWSSLPVMFKPRAVKTYEVTLHGTITRDIIRVWAEAETEDAVRRICADERPSYRIESIVERSKPALSDGSSGQPRSGPNT